MYSFLAFTPTTWLLIVVLCIVVALFVLSENYESENDIVNDLKEPDGPIPFPVIGSMYLLGKYKVPFAGFRPLANVYGDVFRIKMGSVPCVVVNGLENIREVLIAKGEHFDSRPNFMRYSLIFNGDRRNSLAFCDWSELQRIRRELLRAHTFPQSFTAKYQQLDSHINSEANVMLQQILTHSGKPIDFKPLLLHTCANIFMLHFCSMRFKYGHESFSKMTYCLDQIFYEVNQGCVGDFIPWMQPFHRKRFDNIKKWTLYIRQFTTQIVNERHATWQTGRENNDYLDTMLETIKNEDEPQINLDIALFSLEDIIGGHSAITNFLMKVLAYLAVKPDVQDKIRAEIEHITNGTRDVRLTDRRRMPYTESVILETVRMISSPIVPHVASQDSSIAGFKVKKGTTIFLNNYDLNYSQKLWDEPELFKPERFLNVDGILAKPEHFFPFSTGKRSCMGIKLVQLLSFSLTALILQNYKIQPVEGHSYEVPIGDLALPFKSFKFQFISNEVLP